ncbi:MAG: hypothetical protein Kow00123_24120 [Anaerolineales bacterium]
MSMRRLVAGLLAVLLVVVPACNPTPQEFAIYLANGDAGAPVIAMEDIVSYTWATHEIRLTEAAFARVMALHVPVRGLPFVARVDGRQVYAGAFWTPISSMSFDGVTIMLPPGAQDPVIRIELGYPGSGFFTGDDPRFNPQVRAALARAGKLR